MRRAVAMALGLTSGVALLLCAVAMAAGLAVIIATIWLHGLVDGR